MKILLNTFTIIHIKTSHIRFWGVSLRHVVTISLIIFLIFNTIKLLEAVFPPVRPFGFVEAALFIILSIYIAMYWVLAWPKAGEMLNKASDYEHEYENRSAKNSKV